MLARGHLLRALGATWLLRLLLTTACENTVRAHRGSCLRRACKSNCVDRGVTSTRRVRLAPRTPAQTDTLLRVVHAHLCCARAAVHSSTEVRLPATPSLLTMLPLRCAGVLRNERTSHTLSPSPLSHHAAQQPGGVVWVCDRGHLWYSPPSLRVNSTETTGEPSALMFALLACAQVKLC